MPRYKVTATASRQVHTIVEAADEDEAYDIAVDRVMGEDEATSFVNSDTVVSLDLDDDVECLDPEEEDEEEEEEEAEETVADKAAE